MLFPKLQYPIKKKWGFLFLILTTNPALAKRLKKNEVGTLRLYPYEYHFWKWLISAFSKKQYAAKLVHDKLVTKFYSCKDMNLRVLTVEKIS